MTTALDNFLHCSIGGASFQLAEYAYEEEPVVVEGQGRTGTKITLTGKGRIEAAALAALPAALGDAVGGLRIDSQPIVITGIGGASEVAILPPACLDGGPHVRFKLEANDGASLVTRPVSFIATASALPNWGAAIKAYTQTTDTAPSGLRAITRTGKFFDPNGYVRFCAEVVPAFLREFPWPAWVTRTRVDVDPLGQQVSYTLSARELAGRLIGVGTADGDSAALDGECNIRRETDEQGRLVTTYDYDFTFMGDPQRLIDLARPVPVPGDGAALLRETSDTTQIADYRVRCSFAVLEGAGSPLTSFSQSLRMLTADPTLEEHDYPGADPVAVQAPARLVRVAQSGRATAVGCIPRPPAPIFPSFLSDPPELTITQVNLAEWATDWSYTFKLEPGDPITEGLWAAFVTYDVVPWQIARPADPGADLGFVTEPKRLGAPA